VVPSPVNGSGRSTEPLKATETCTMTNTLATWLSILLYLALGDEMDRYAPCSVGKGGPAEVRTPMPVRGSRRIFLLSSKRGAGSPTKTFAGSRLPDSQECAAP
jgi:hypothetical protein